MQEKSDNFRSADEVIGVYRKRKTTFSMQMR